MQSTLDETSEQIICRDVLYREFTFFFFSVIIAAAHPLGWEEFFLCLERLSYYKDSRIGFSTQKKSFSCLWLLPSITCDVLIGKGRKSEKIKRSISSGLDPFFFSEGLDQYLRFVSFREKV